MADNKFTTSGFKYPERIYGQKFQHMPIDKPALLMHLGKNFRPDKSQSLHLLVKPNQMRF